MVIPTDEERANGWTEEALTAYVNGRLQAQAQNAGIIEETYRPWGERLNPNRPTHSKSRYNPLRW